MGRATDAVLYGKVKLPGDGEDTPDRQVEIVVARHENGSNATLEVSGCGLGGHEVELRFDRSGEPGHGAFDELVSLSFDGDEAPVLDLPFIPTAAIVAIDGLADVRIDPPTSKPKREKAESSVPPARKPAAKAAKDPSKR